MYYLIILFFFIFYGISQAGELWTKYDISDSVTSITGYGNFIWAGTNSGLIRINRLDGLTKKYTINNGFPSNKVTSVCSDENGVIYVALIDSIRNQNNNVDAYILSLHDDTITDYSLISGLRNDIFYPYKDIGSTNEEVSFIIPSINNIFLGVNLGLWPGGHGINLMIAVIKFDGTNWLTVYNKSVFYDMAQDTERLLIYNIFINPYNLAYPFTVITDKSTGKLKNISYDKNSEWDMYFLSNQADYIEGSNKTTYTPENSGLTGIINVMAIDKNYTKWFGCNDSTALVSYDNKTWNSYIHDDWNNSTIIKFLEVDDDNCVWVVTSKPAGLYRFNPNAITAVEAESITPLTFTLSTAYPNPFNASTTISFTLNKPEKVNLAIYNLAGQKVRELAAGDYSAGSHTAVWDGCDNNGTSVSSGVYLARMESGGVSKVVRMAMVK